jgi:signal transduction histidine kinase
MFCDRFRFKVCGVGHAPIDTAPPLPLLKRLAQHSYTVRERLTIDLALVLTFSALVGFMAPRSNPCLTGSGFAIANWAGIIAGACLFLVRRQLPWASLIGLTPLALASILLRTPAVPFFYLVFCVGTVVARSEQRTGMALGGLYTGMVLAAALIAGGTPRNPTVNGTIAAVAIMLVGWLAGENARGSRIYMRYRADREAAEAVAAEADRAERTSRAIADERVIIARELHDIVAHSMSVVAVRSGVARMVADSRPEEAAEALAIIETTARQSLAEMRMMVSMLRHRPGSKPDLGPLPGLADLDRLITQLAAAGVEVEVAVEGPARPLAPVADLTAYRILQEALTNVVRHAGPTTAKVRLAFEADVLDIEIANAGSAKVRAPLDGGPTGHGLLGMRERAALFGGTLEAGPAGAGFRVHTSLRIDG